MDKTTLLARSGTIAGIEKLIRSYWFNEMYRVNEQTLSIERIDGKQAPQDFRVRKAKGAYLFEYFERA